MPIDDAETIEPFAGYATPPAPARFTRVENAAGPSTRACTPGSRKTSAATSTQRPLPTDGPGSSAVAAGTAVVVGTVAVVVTTGVVVVAAESVVVVASVVVSLVVVGGAGGGPA